MRTRKILTLIIVLSLVSLNISAAKLKILIVTGGHDFDRESFFQMFDSFNNLSYTELVHPQARVQLGTIDLDSFDAVVFYDMPKTITEEETYSYYRLLEAGKGLLFLHHAICAYQDWPDFENIIGGKYYEKKKDDKFGVSSYEHDIDFYVQMVHNPHPVSKGMDDFVLHDELYKNLEVLPEIYPLLSTDHPKSNILIGWTLKNINSKIVYIQPGHDKNTYMNLDYQRLIKQAIKYITSNKD